MAEEGKAPKTSGSEDNSKTMAALAYLIFFIPMLTTPRNEFSMYHAKQGLVLLLASILGSVAMTIISMVTLGIGLILYPIFYLAIFVLFVMGIMNALNGKETPLPLIGQFASNFNF